MAGSDAGWQASAVSFRFVHAGVAAGAVFLLLSPSACKSDDAAAGENGELPPVNSECRGFSAIHPQPLCDGCTRDLCCPEVQACVGSKLCDGLVRCLYECERGQTSCTDACKGRFADGDAELSVLNACAQRLCPVACGTAYIDESR